MVSAIQVLAAAAVWLGLLYKLRDLVREPDNRALRPLCAGVAALAVAFTLQIKPVYTTLEQHTAAGLGAVLGDCLALIASAAFQSLFLQMSAESGLVVGRARRRVLLTAIVVTAILVLFATTPSNQSAMDATRDTDHQVPLISAYTYLYLAALLPTMLGLATSSWQYSVVCQRYSLRYGLRVLTVGGLFGILYALAKVSYMVGYQLNIHIPGPYGETGSMLGAAAGVLTLVGLTMPAWGRYIGLDALGGWLEMNRSYARLLPLWALLHDAVPDIALVRPRPGFGSRFRWRGAGFVRYRRVIEIWDARLRLRPYFDEQAADRARELGTAAGLSGQRLDALVEAARLAGATRRKGTGSSEAEPVPPGQTVTRTEVDADVRWLEQVADALRSPVLARALSTVD